MALKQPIRCLSQVIAFVRFRNLEGPHTISRCHYKIPPSKFPTTPRLKNQILKHPQVCLQGFYSLASWPPACSIWRIAFTPTSARPARRGLTYLPFFLLLGIALLIALGFEFVNGFHDTANAVATVIYTHSMPPNMAVVWSGVFNFIGVLVSSGAVAFGIISLLPVELILQVGSTAGFAMVFALLIAAILWNLGTWWLGLPASSSHTLIGSIIGVGIANALMHGRDGTSGVDWAQATKVGYSLLLSPMIGFGVAALVLLLLKALFKRPELYQEPKGNQPPPWGIRALLILTCTGVSFAHGSNDGQKGMGLIMLILVGTVPLAYALNRAMPADQMWSSCHRCRGGSRPAEGRSHNFLGNPRPAVTLYIRTKINERTCPSLPVAGYDIANQVRIRLAGQVPAAAVGNIRNDMYLASEAIRALTKGKVNDATKQNVTKCLQQGARCRDQVHPFLGQGCGRHRARPGHDGRLEAHR